MQKLEELFEKFEKLEVMLKPMIDEQKKVKEEIGEELDKLNLDSFDSGRVSATKVSSERVMYPKKLIEEHLDKETINKISIVQNVAYTKVTLRKEKDA